MNDQTKGRDNLLKTILKPFHGNSRGISIHRRLAAYHFIIIDAKLSDSEIIQKIDQLRKEKWEKENLG